MRTFHLLFIMCIRRFRVGTSHGVPLEKNSPFRSSFVVVGSSAHDKTSYTVNKAGVPRSRSQFLGPEVASKVHSLRSQVASELLQSTGRGEAWIRVLAWRFDGDVGEGGKGHQNDLEVYLTITTSNHQKGDRNPIYHAHTLVAPCRAVDQ